MVHGTNITDYFLISVKLDIGFFTLNLRMTFLQVTFFDLYFYFEVSFFIKLKHWLECPPPPTRFNQIQLSSSVQLQTED
jgi:hypothetical protein